jgi:pullulanase/glycogen debranching enzyme
MATWSETEGSPQPPGATWLEKEKSYNFSLYSRHATGVTLLLYTARDLVNPQDILCGSARFGRTLRRIVVFAAFVLS